MIDTRVSLKLPGELILSHETLCLLFDYVERNGSKCVSSTGYEEMPPSEFASSMWARRFACGRVGSVLPYEQLQRGRGGNLTLPLWIQTSHAVFNFGKKES